LDAWRWKLEIFVDIFIIAAGFVGRLQRRHCLIVKVKVLLIGFKEWDNNHVFLGDIVLTNTAVIYKCT
jgi:hypothetical protein